MLIHEYPIEWYIAKLKSRKYFCLPGYSDAEFYSMMKLRLNTQTGLGQMIRATHGDLLTGVMQRRQRDKRWLFAIPKCLSELPLFEKYPVDSFLKENNISIEGYERDMILDDLARDAGLYPLIKQLQEMDTILVGPEEFSNGGLAFLDYKVHVSIPSPNLHTEPNGIKWTVDTILRRNYKAIHLISAGVSAPIIIDKLYEANPDNFYIDCGSIWDAFCGIGGQRQWRADLYSDPTKLEEWKRRNIYGPRFDEEPNQAATVE